MYMAQLGGISYIIIKWIYNVYITFFGGLSFRLEVWKGL